MTEYAVGIDGLFAIDAESAEDAEAELRRRVVSGELDEDDVDCIVYEELPEADDD